MTTKEKTIEKMAEYLASDIINKCGQYFDKENKRLLKIGYINQVRQMFIEFPELAIVNRDANINFSKYGILYEQAKEILRDGFIREVKD
jgi:hypothetical protein